MYVFQHFWDSVVCDAQIKMCRNLASYLAVKSGMTGFQPGLMANPAAAGFSP